MPVQWPWINSERGVLYWRVLCQMQGFVPLLSTRFATSNPACRTKRQPTHLVASFHKIKQILSGQGIFKQLRNFVNLICKSHSCEKEVTMILIAPRRPTNSQLRNHGLSQLVSAVRLVRQTATDCFKLRMIVEIDAQHSSWLDTLLGHLGHPSKAIKRYQELRTSEDLWRSLKYF